MNAKPMRLNLSAITEGFRRDELRRVAAELVEETTTPLRIATVGTLPGLVILDTAETPVRLLPEQARSLAELLWRKADEAGP